MHCMFTVLKQLFSELNDFLATLDRRADETRQKIKHHAAERKRRQRGSDAACSPPENSPKWTVSKEWRKGILSSALLCIVYDLYFCLTVDHTVEEIVTEHNVDLPTDDLEEE